MVVAARRGDDPGTQIEATGSVNSYGLFQITLDGLEQDAVVRAHYLGGYGLAPSESERLAL